jgi:hypothetical protein
VITDISFWQHQRAWERSQIGTIVVINPRPNQYRLATGAHVLADFSTDGADEVEDVANAITLCRLHYQHSFSEDT